MSALEEPNPYAGHAELSQLEADVLWEYAKLARAIKRVDTLAKETADNPNDGLLNDLRALEKKMGLVLTLFKASVWAVITDQRADDEKRQMELEQQTTAEQEAGQQDDSMDEREERMLRDL